MVEARFSEILISRMKIKRRVFDILRFLFRWRFWCIYCKEKYPRWKSAKAHIIPKSLGSILKIYNVCKTCNNWIGTEVEAELLYSPIIRDKLSELKIRSKRGRKIHFVQTGRRATATTIHPETGEKIKVNMELGFEGEKHSIIPTKNKSGKLTIDDKDFDSIKMNFEKKGCIVVSKDEFVRRKGEFKKGDKVCIYEKFSPPPYSIEVTMWHNIKKVKRALAKISLEYLCYRQGPKFVMKDDFDNIREYIKKGEPEPIGTFFEDEVDGIHFPSRKNCHALFLFLDSDGNIVCIIDLFGAMKFLLVLGKGVGLIPDLENAKITFVDPINKSVWEAPFHK